MAKPHGQYIYCIIKKPRSFNLDLGGVGGGKIALIDSGRCAAVTSDSAVIDYPITRENTLTHQRVIEGVMQRHSPVLPVSFGTVAENAAAVKEKILDAKQNELLTALEDIDGKVELGLKAIWLNLPKIFQKVVLENPELRRLKKAMAGRRLGRDEAIEVGKLVAEAIASRREVIKEAVLSLLGGIFVDHKETPLLGEEMVFNIAFLIPERNQKAFDTIVRNLDAQYQDDEIHFRYVGPMPAFNFVKVPITLV